MNFNFFLKCVIYPTIFRSFCPILNKFQVNESREAKEMDTTLLRDPKSDDLNGLDRSYEHRPRQQ